MVPWREETGDTEVRRAAFRRQVLGVCESFGRNKGRKQWDERMGPEDGEIECTETEPDQHDCRRQDGEQTMQIEGDVRRGGRGGMVMSLVGCGCLADTIGMDKAHCRGHGHETGNEDNEYLPGF